MDRQQATLWATLNQGRSTHSLYLLRTGWVQAPLRGPLWLLQVGDHLDLCFVCLLWAVSWVHVYGLLSVCYCCQASVAIRLSHLGPFSLLPGNNPFWDVRQNIPLLRICCLWLLVCFCTIFFVCTGTPQPAAFPIGAIIGIAAGGALAILVVLMILICVVICRFRVNRRGFYPTYEDKASEPPTMLRYSASLRSISSQTVVPSDARMATKENEFYV